jgi:DNA-binding CsgD family transcriptional regulator
MEGMLCPVLIERRGELGQLTAGLDAAADGSGGAIFVPGDEGVGKSRLTRELSDQASGRGFTIMTGRGAQSAVPVPYRPVTEALLGAARSGAVSDMPAISGYRAALGSLVPEWSKPGDVPGQVSPVVVGEALSRLLTASGRQSGLLVLEDLHWADSETLAMVDYLVDSIASVRMLCVFTLRNVPSAARDLLRAASARRAATVVDIPRLTPAAVGQMATACLEVEHLPAAVGRLLDDCDGLPFAVEEVLAAAVSSGEIVRDASGWHVDDDISTGVPDSIAGSVRSRLDRLDPATRDVIVSAAVLGRQFDWTLLPGVAGVGETEALDALRRAREVQLVEQVPGDPGVGTFRFRHSLTRDAIVADLLPPELSSRAAASAAAIVRAYPGLPGTWCELVAELYELAGDPQAAARLLMTSGRRDLHKGAVGSALEVLRQAQKLLAGHPPGEPMLGIEVDEVILEALAQAGDYKQMAPLAEDLIARLDQAGADPRRQALIQLRAANSGLGDAPAAVERHLSAAAAVADRLRDPELSGRVDAVAARSALAAGLLDEAERLSRRALATAEAAVLGGWAAEVALESLEVIGNRERGRDLRAARRAFERSREVADSKELGLWRIRAQHELSTIAMLQDGTASQLSDVVELAADAGATKIAMVGELQLANLASLGTELDQALQMALKCQQTASQIKAPRVQAVATCLEANIAAIRADRRQAEDAVLRAEAILPGDSGILHHAWGQTRVLASLFRGDVDRALDEDATAASYGAGATGRRPALGNYSVLLAPRRSLALHALLTAIGDGDGHAAIEQARNNGAAASWNAGCLAYAEAVLAGRARDPDRAAALAEEGSAAFEPFAPWWNHLARRLVAPCALRDAWGEPLSWLREAASGFQATSHEQLASSCRGLLRRAGVPVPRSGRGNATVPPQLRRVGITSREMDVFLLVADGKSNTAIATSLYISPKTVQTHIASLIARTGKTSRRELVAYAAAYAAGAELPDHA